MKRILLVLSALTISVGCGDDSTFDPSEREVDSSSDDGGNTNPSSDTNSNSNPNNTGNGDGSTSPTAEGPVLAIGDSLLDWNRDMSASIPDVYGARSGRSVTNAAVGGARLLGGERLIPSQYAESSRNFAQVLLDGGGNDLGGDGCGCGNCLPVVDQIISADLQSGGMVDLLNQITADGSQAILLGYYLPPPFGEFAACDEEFVELNARYSSFADSDPMVRFVNMGNVIDHSRNPEYFDDVIHPSVAGSRVVGEYIAEQLGERAN
ncbi:MAG: SGNH/GDSL hydrolase family protein [Myxococcota bacterium]